MAGKITTRPGHVDKHRHSISGIKAEEESKWGQQTAYERYSMPRGQHETEAHGLGPQHPQAPEDRHEKNYDNDTSGWLRAEGEDATTRPGFVKGYTAALGEPGTRGGPKLRDGDPGPHK